MKRRNYYSNTPDKDRKDWTFDKISKRAVDTEINFPATMYLYNMKHFSFMSSSWRTKHLHRVEGAACELLDKTPIAWWHFGWIHKEDGPSVSGTSVGLGFIDVWSIYGIRLTETYREIL